MEPAETQRATPEQLYTVPRVFSIMMLELASRHGLTQDDMESCLRTAIQTAVNADAGDAKSIEVNNNGVRHLSTLLGMAGNTLQARTDRLQ